MRLRSFKLKCRARRNTAEDDSFMKSLADYHGFQHAVFCEYGCGCVLVWDYGSPGPRELPASTVAAIQQRLAQAAN
jgi:hypothetical protein